MVVSRKASAAFTALIAMTPRRKISLWGMGSKESINSCSRDDNAINKCSQNHFYNAQQKSTRYNSVSPRTTLHEEDIQGSEISMHKNTINYSSQSAHLHPDYKAPQSYTAKGTTNMSYYNTNKSKEKRLTVHENPLSSDLQLKIRHRSKTLTDLFSETKQRSFRRFSEPSITLESETASLMQPSIVPERVLDGLDTHFYVAPLTKGVNETQKHLPDIGIFKFEY